MSKTLPTLVMKSSTSIFIIVLSYKMSTRADALPLLMVSIDGAAPAVYDRRAFAEGSERPDAFFDTELPDELVGVVHSADFDIVIRAVNRLRAESWALESSKCHALTRWLRAPLSSSLSSALSGAIDAEAVRAGRIAIAEFLRNESEQRWCIGHCVFYFEFFAKISINLTRHPWLFISCVWTRRAARGIKFSYEPLPAAAEVHANLLAPADADASLVLPLGSFAVCCSWCSGGGGSGVDGGGERVSSVAGCAVDVHFDTR